VLLYGSETWTIKARDTRRIRAAEKKYMRRTAGYIWTDYKKVNVYLSSLMMKVPDHVYVLGATYFV
jgi:hypothetical protein